MGFFFPSGKTATSPKDDQRHPDPTEVTAAADSVQLQDDVAKTGKHNY